MLTKEEIEKYNRNLIRWVKNHYWDSLEKEKDLILRHLRTFTGDLTEADIDLFAKLAKAEAELAEFKADVALLLDQKDDYQEKLFEENEALKAEIEDLKKIIWRMKCE